MKFEPSLRIQKLKKYPMAVITDKIAELRAEGVPVTDFGVGDPTSPTPRFIQDRAIRAIKEHECSGYPSYVGMPDYRRACSDYMKRRFDVELDPGKEICSSIGAKEAVFNFAEAYVNPGDYVLIPTPGYPPYKTGTTFAEGIPFYYAVHPDNNFEPDIYDIPQDVLEKAKIMWVNYPHNPTGKQASKECYRRIYDFCAKHNIIMAVDEPYADIYFDENDKPASALQVAKEGVVVFQSLSKRSNMTGWRIGFVCGDESIISTFKALKTNIDSGTPNFIQEAAITALADDEHCREARKEYKEKRDILLECFDKMGFPASPPDAGMFIWQRLPQGVDDIEFATKLLTEDIAVAVIPGSLISDEDFKGRNPGKGFIRLALVPSVEEVEQACERMLKMEL